MLESAFQRKLIKQFEKDGWWVLKIMQCTKPGTPDLLLCRGAEYRFVEVKAKGGRLSPIQKLRHEQMRAFGISVEVVYP